MSWPAQSADVWNQNMPPEMMGMGSYTPEQWAAMQQQNWQQWAQWQQQFAQWQSQYGDKFAEQMQVMQGGMPPLPVAAAPPAPPPAPPEQPPPPPPHENNQPLYSVNQANTSARPVQSTPAYNHNNSNIPGTITNQPVEYNNQNWQQKSNAEALKKLAEEERLFDIQFKKWQEEINKWRQENINHPDKQAYKEYELKFETCMAQLIERRQQMNQKKAGLMSNTAQISTVTGNRGQIQNEPKEMPYSNISNVNKDQVYQDNRNIQNSYNNSGPNTVQHKNLPFQQQTNLRSIPTNDRYSSHNDSRNMSHNTSFLPSAESSKGIPGLDLVTDRPVRPPQNDIIDMTNEQHDSKAGKHPQDFSAITKGINNILGDEKIMNILSIVRGQYESELPNQQQQPQPNNQIRNPQSYQNNQHNMYGPPPPNLQEQQPRNTGNNWNQYSDDYNKAGPDFNRQGPPPMNNQRGTNNRFNEGGMHKMQGPMGPHSNVPKFQGHNNVQEPYRNQGNIQENQQINPRQQSRDNLPVQGPLTNMRDNNKNNWKNENANPIPMNQFQRSDMNASNNFQRHDINAPNNFQRPDNNAPNNFQRHDINAPNNFQQTDVRPQGGWSEDLVFIPSIIVDYEHKSLRLKARDFIEPVHTFDYNHISKDGNKAVNYDDDIDFKRESNRGHISDYRRDGREFERRNIRDDKFDMPRGRDDYIDRRRDRDDRGDRSDYRRRDDRSDKYRSDDRLSFNDDRDRYRAEDRNDDRDRIRGDDDRDRHRRESERDRDRYRDRRGDVRNRSRERDTRKRGHSRENETAEVVEKKLFFDIPATKNHVVMIDDLLEPPGRDVRPEKIVIILRGLPGSGKSYLAKLIRDKEAEHGGAARIMSIDDYFMQESEIEEKDPTTGKIVKKTGMKFEYDASLEETYFRCFQRAFKRSISDGYYTFLIYDAPNETLKHYAAIWNFARQHSFQVYVCTTTEKDITVCHKRNIHNRTLDDIQVLASRFFETPSHHIILDATTLLQSAAIQEVDMADADDDVIMEESPAEMENTFTSKWERMEGSNELARLDGINKPLRPSQLSMEDYLQLDDWQPAHSAKPGKKSVRWADIEEKRQQEKMRAIGFVVGQTDWTRMTDPTMGSSALTQTKYIERVKRN